MRLYEIYKTTFTNGKFYIGQHLMPDGETGHSRYLGSGALFKKCLVLYGRRNAAKWQLAIAPTKNLANILEKLYIELARHSFECLNITEGGEGRPEFQMPESQKELLAKIHRGRIGYYNQETGQAVFLFPTDDPPEGFIRGSNNGGYIWTNNGIKNIKVRDGILPDEHIWGKKGWTEEQRKNITGKKRGPQTEAQKEAHRKSMLVSWQDSEFRRRAIAGMKENPHGPLSVPIHNKGKMQYNNGTDQLYLKPGDSIPDGYSPGGLPRPDREFAVTDEFRSKVSLNNNRTVFYRVENTETRHVHFFAGTVAIGKFLGISPGQAASVLCRGLIPRRGKLFRLFNEWEFIKITKEEYLLAQNE